jgi:hypothetical protein
MLWYVCMVYSGLSLDFVVQVLCPPKLADYREQQLMHCLQTSAAEDLLKLTRELKELWIFGPLRGIGEGEGEGAMEEDSKKVEELVAAQLKKKHEEEQQKA